VPQLWEINIRPVQVGTTYRLPRTIVVASTYTALQGITTKVTAAMRAWNLDEQFAGLKVSVSLATAYDPGSLDQIEARLEDFANGDKSVIVCSPDYVKGILHCDVEQIWWLNVKVKEKEHRLAVEEMLEGL
jgi:hypothetical protein